VTADEMSDYTWLRPEIEAEIKFAEWTVDGRRKTSSKPSLACRHDVARSNQRRGCGRDEHDGNLIERMPSFESTLSR